MAVFLHHAGDHLKAMGGPAWLADSFEYGFSGADVFFVLSGVIMWETTQGKQGPLAAASFFGRRVTRIYGGYWPVLALCLLVQTEARSSPNWDRVGSFLLLNPNHWQHFIPQAWSLSFELYFYVLFALLVLARPAWRRGLVLSAVAVICAANLATWPRPATFVVDVAMLEFAAGILVAWLVRFAPRARLVAGGLLALSVGILAVGVHWHLVVGSQRTLAFGGFATALVASVLVLDRAGVSPWPDWMVRLGDSSYALYLLHGLALHFLYTTGARDAFARSGWPTLGLTLWLVLSLLACHVWYLAVEARTLSWSRWLVDALVARMRRGGAEGPVVVEGGVRKR